jgi:hypothetical protein
VRSRDICRSELSERSGRFLFLVAFGCGSNLGDARSRNPWPSAPVERQRIQVIRRRNHDATQTDQHPPDLIAKVANEIEALVVRFATPDRHRSEKQLLDFSALNRFHNAPNAMSTVARELNASSAVVEEHFATALDETQLLHCSDHLAYRRATEAEELRNPVLVWLDRTGFRVKHVKNIESRRREVISGGDRVKQLERRAVRAFESKRQLVHVITDSTVHADCGHRECRFELGGMAAASRAPTILNSSGRN